MKTALGVVAAILLVALGFLMGSPATSPPPPQVQVPPRIPDPAAPDAEDLAVRLKDSEYRVDMLRKEIVGQDLRRQALEAQLAEQALRIQKKVAQRPQPGAPAEASEPLAKEFLGWAATQCKSGWNTPRENRENQNRAVSLSQALLEKPEAQDAYVEALRNADVGEMVQLWDVGAGTDNQSRIPKAQHLRDGLWALLSAETEPRKRGLLARLLQTQGDDRITREMMEEINRKEMELRKESPPPAR